MILHRIHILEQAHKINDQADVLSALGVFEADRSDGQDELVLRNLLEDAQ